MSEMDVRIIGGVRNYVKLFFGHAFSVCPKTVDFGLESQLSLAKFFLDLIENQSPCEHFMLLYFLF